MLILCLASYRVWEKSLVKHIFCGQSDYRMVTCHRHVWNKNCDSDLKEPDYLSFEEIRLSVFEALARWKAQPCIHKLLCKHEKGYHVSVTTVMYVQWEPKLNMHFTRFFSVCAWYGLCSYFVHIRPSCFQREQHTPRHRWVQRCLSNG